MNVPLNTSDKKKTKELAQNLISEITRLSKIAMKENGGRPLRFMEVCGTHTVAIFRGGIRQLLQDSVDIAPYNVDKLIEQSCILLYNQY